MEPSAGIEPAPADYETEALPLSCSVFIVIRRLSPLSTVLLGGFWMGNWMGNSAAAQPLRAGSAARSDLYSSARRSDGIRAIMPAAAVNATEKEVFVLVLKGSLPGRSRAARHFERESVEPPVARDIHG